MKIMQPPPNRNKIQRNLLGFSGFLFVIAILLSFVSIQNKNIEKPESSVKEAKSSASKEVNEMLFSIKSVIIFD
jgi:hypothetical protein